MSELRALVEAAVEFRHPDAHGGTFIALEEAVDAWQDLSQQDRDAALAAPLTVEALATALRDLGQRGLVVSLPNAGTSWEAIAAAILAALPAPPAAPTSDWFADLLADHEGHTLRVQPPIDGSEEFGPPMPAALICEDHDDEVHAPTSEQDRLAAIGEAVERLPKDREWHIGYGNDMWLVIVYDPHTGGESRRGAGATLPTAVDAALADRGQEEPPYRLTDADIGGDVRDEDNPDGS